MRESVWSSHGGQMEGKLHPTVRRLKDDLESRARFHASRILRQIHSAAHRSRL